MRTCVVLCGLAALLALTSAAARGGVIDSNLDEIMASKAAGETVSTLVFLKDRVDGAALNASLNKSRATLAARHETVVRALQEKAQATQAGLSAYLDDLVRAGRATEVQAYWIDNSFRVDATPAEIRLLAERPDVEIIYYNYEIETIAPVAAKPDTPTAPDEGQRTPVTGVVAVRAPEVWAMGFTGEGMLTSTLDTGVDGNHPALASRWRGLDPLYAGHPQWAWFDPRTNTTFPQSFGAHGTHTMGTVCGGAPGEQIGVAPGAQWIHAAVIDRVSIPTTVADAKLAFQWIIDPDGNPSTVWDVPTVNSNSWGVTTSHGYPPCDQNFWSYIDNCEAAGIVLLFSAGNEGPGAETLRRPADRATNGYNALAVGAVDANNSSWPVASFSSRGPSHCTPNGSAAIKPEMAAPGVAVRSSVPGGGYESFGWDGTSMASPHVNGVIVLMRQACPDLSVDEIKQILYDTAHDLGATGKDNNYGWGMVDAFEAVSLALSMCSGAPRARDAHLQSPVETPLTVTLLATDYDGLPDPPGALTYIITTLPTAGNTLTDIGNGHVIEAGDLPYSLVSYGNQVLYTPAPGYYGTDIFQFKANDGGTPPDGGDSNIATVDILVMYPAPVITTTSLPPATLNGLYYPVTLTATNGQPPLTWSVSTSGAYTRLPNGLTLTPAGVLSGIPTESGTFTPTFKVTDALSRINQKVIQLQVNIGPIPPIAQSQNLVTEPGGVLNVVLHAVDDGLPNPPATLDYIITALPARGRLRDPGAGAIQGVPYMLVNHGTVVEYDANIYYVGADSFTFVANDGGTPPDGGNSNPGQIAIDIVATPELVHSYPLDVNPGWVTEGAWAFGSPAGAGTHNRDPVSGYSGANVYGYNLSGDYLNSHPARYLTTTAINLGNVTAAELRFWRWLGVEQYDHATIDVSNDGTSWTSVWDSLGMGYNEAAWSPQAYDIHAVADRQAAVYVRWGMGPTDYSVTYPGWNIDDVEIWGIVHPTVAGDLNCDGEVTFADINPFVQIMTDLPGWQAANPDCPLSNGDINGDGQVGFADINPFVSLLTGP